MVVQRQLLPDQDCHHRQNLTQSHPSLHLIRYSVGNKYLLVSVILHHLDLQNEVLHRTLDTVFEYYYLQSHLELGYILVEVAVFVLRLLVYKLLVSHAVILILGPLLALHHILEMSLMIKLSQIQILLSYLLKVT